MNKRSITRSTQWTYGVQARYGDVLAKASNVLFSIVVMLNNTAPAIKFRIFISLHRFFYTFACFFYSGIYRGAVFSVTSYFITLLYYSNDIRELPICT